MCGDIVATARVFHISGHICAVAQGVCFADDHGKLVEHALDQDFPLNIVPLGGTFSAEHGVGTLKLGSMARLKDPVALEVMRAIKGALDPKGLMNPGKVIPE